jgi:nucleoside-diphosphate-sugar epimerase
MLDLIINDSDRIIQKVDMRSLNNKRVLITGATGLIGLHLLSVLKTLKVKYNYNIDIYCWVFSDIEKHLMPMFEGCAIIKADLTDVTAIDNLQKMFVETLSGVDYIFHAAGYGQPQKFTSNKIKTIELNTVATTNLFKLLNLDGRFLFCSTSEIYSGIDQEGI